MKLINLYHFILGYKKMEATGRRIEKYINLLNCNNIEIWDIKKIDSTKATFKGMNTQVKQINTIAQKSGYKIDILKEYGKNKIINKIKERKFFIMFIILFSFLIFLSSFFIWNIEISGAKKVDEHDILMSLRSIGFKEGKYKYNINLTKVENNILSKYKNLSYIEINFEGTKAKVKIKESNIIPNTYKKSKPVHLVAKEDGVIDSIIAYNGICKVKKGDKVKKGQILISGKINYETEGKNKHYYIHALGDILTVKDKTFNHIKINPYKIKNTDKFIKERTIYLKKHSFDLKNNMANENYIKIKEEKTNIKLLFIPLPIEERISKCYNIEKLDKKSEKQLEKEVIKILNSKGKVDKDNIIKIYLSIKPLKSNYIDITAKITLRENIAKEKIIKK